MQSLNKILLEVPAPSGKNIVQVVGHNRFLNELLANYLESDLKLNCRRSAGDIYPAGSPEELPEICLIFIDSMDIDLAYHWEKIMAFSSSLSRQSICAMFNVDPLSGIENESMRRGIRGLFYRNDSPEAICRGVRKILEGEIWYRREDLFNCIVRQAG